MKLQALLLLATLSLFSCSKKDDAAPAASGTSSSGGAATDPNQEPVPTVPPTVEEVEAQLQNVGCFLEERQMGHHGQVRVVLNCGQIRDILEELQAAEQVLDAYVTALTDAVAVDPADDLAASKLKQASNTLRRVRARIDFHNGVQS